MISRKELKSLGIEMNDEQWEKFCRQMSDLQDKMWEEDHPLDD